MTLQQGSNQTYVLSHLTFFPPMNFQLPYVDIRGSASFPPILPFIPATDEGRLR